jgi:hypothetical protein
MPLKKGQTNNPNGRPPGALNKISKGLKENITEFLEINFDEVIRTWNQLESKEKLSFWKDLLQYSIPKQREQTLDFDSLSEDQLDAIIESLQKKIIDKPNQI